ncbi:hypothetical protein EVAR_92964_1 [Eumeta japonica]|uniref:Uncharacterized protein n=1 Tax=Eumeta variegata TaxID=151549 RepID=A0A4C1TDU5_EUMVA|nr:hypothetical protein EVAR_92964_1 [Eumeta japonica]
MPVDGELYLRISSSITDNLSGRGSPVAIRPGPCPSRLLAPSATDACPFSSRPLPDRSRRRLAHSLRARDPSPPNKRALATPFLACIFPWPFKTPSHFNLEKVLSNTSVKRFALGS